ncbi:MAG TPA: aminoacyl-tRNA hydrolase [Steroidobacteraceae bacterium]|nr:aminoacyl-tRNA hydrolase [Steroidobacteraceae bacterium]
MAAFPLRLVVGLGNPGPEHALTRHNVGFWFVDALAHATEARFREHRKHQAELARIKIADHELTLVKPLTYVNRSGLAIRSVAEYYRVTPGEILVAYDELDLQVGTVRLKRGGGAGGHNGVKDTIAHIGDDFWRLRVGIGHPGNKAEVIDYVLRRAPHEDEEAIIECVAAAVEIMPFLLSAGAEKAMNKLHTENKGKDQDAEKGEETAGKRKKPAEQDG